MSPRKEFTAKTKRAAFERCHVNGVPRCEAIIVSEPGVSLRCSEDLRVKSFHYDHADADFYSKDNSLENCTVLCQLCHKLKTRTVDVPKISKTRRLDRTRMKTKRRGPPMPGSKASPFKHKLDGTWERRR